MIKSRTYQPNADLLRIRQNRGIADTKRIL